MTKKWQQKQQQQKGEAIKKRVGERRGGAHKKQKKNKCTQSKDMDQPRHLSSLIGVFPQRREREVL